MLYHNIHGYDVKVARRCRLRQQFYSFQSELRGLLLTILRGKRQQRRARTEDGVVVTIVLARVERTRVSIVGTATTVEPRIAGIHEARERLTPGLIVTGDRLDSGSFVGSCTTTSFKSTNVIVVMVF